MFSRKEYNSGTARWETRVRARCVERGPWDSHAHSEFSTFHTFTDPEAFRTPHSWAFMAASLHGWVD